MNWLTVLVLAAAFCCGFAAKILVLVPMPAKSHASLFEKLVPELAKKGHQVTYVSAFPIKNVHKNIINIDLKDSKEMLYGDKKMDLFDLKDFTWFENVFFLPLMGLNLCDGVLKVPEVAKLVRTKEKFDLIFGEAFLIESLMAGFGHLSGAPLVSFGTFMPSIWVNYMIGNPAPSAYVPDPFTDHPSKMSFLQRAHNFMVGTAAELSHVYHYLPKQDAVMRKHFGDHLPPIHDMIKNTSLVLVNHHFSLAFPRPLFPNMVEVGGIHVDTNQKLPQDLQKFMDDSKNGVVLFSLGSNLQSSDMSKEKIELFMNAFSRLKQNVLWKFENDALPGKPKNVKISKWLPQTAVLAHPNTKLFITHGGLLSTTESIYYGVPLVGIPIFGDQPLNMRQVENAGFGRTLSFDSLTSDQLVNMAEEVTNNPKYRQKALERSKLLRDTPLSPLDTAVYWLEYVIRHKGAPHLRSSVQDLKLHEKYLWDVLAAFAVSALAGSFIVCYLIRLIFCCLCCRSKKTEKVSAHKKKK